MSRTQHAVPVKHQGQVIGSLTQPGASYRFNTRINGERQFITFKGVSDLEAALVLARQAWEQGGAVALPKPAPIVPAKRAETLGRALVRYLREYKKANRHSSWSRTRRPLSAFITFMGGWRQSPSVITRQMLIQYRDKRAEIVERATANGDLRRAKTFINWLRAEELLTTDPTFKVKKLKTSRVAKETILPAMAENVIRTFGDGWLGDLAVTLAQVGLRPSEALNIRAVDVDEKQRLLRVRPWEYGEHKFEIKDNEERTLELNKPALDVLLRRKLAMKKDDEKNPMGLLWPSPDGASYGCDKNYDNFAKVWRKALPKSALGKAFPYSFRHYFATVTAKGWPIEKLSIYMGHSSIAVTEQHYVDKKAIKTGAPPVTVTDVRKAQ